METKRGSSRVPGQKISRKSRSVRNPYQTCPEMLSFSELTLGRQIALQNAKNQWGNQWDARGPTPRGLALHASSFRLFTIDLMCFEIHFSCSVLVQEATAFQDTFGMDCELI